ncbi:hypothetical protein K438DRAFT_1865528 [Mycena galopus ATCC 62051]|nr:hypothetical protein K438DRAFT_1865528 [Mycena galopus ATCC 62051]
MGTRGYRVYRHKGYYHVHYNHWDSYPSNLGVKVAAEIPRGEEEYKKWLKNLREELDHHFENSKDGVDSNGDDYRITTERPTNDIMIEWVYEIDLDHEVFLVDSNPLFALSNMPGSNYSFVRWIGFDAYSHRACDPSTPEKHRYNWTSLAPDVDDSVISHYATRHSVSEDQLSISELLGTTRLVNNCEAVRNAIYEVIIGRMMGIWEIGHHIRVLETATDRADISGDLLSMGVDMVQVAFGPMVFSPEIKPKKQEGPYTVEEMERDQAEFLAMISGVKKKKTRPIPKDFAWLTPDVCLRIITHLDDERNAKKSILELVDEVALNRQPGRVTYGILFSFFHCVIVRVDPQNGFKSTAALQFLPSFYATSPSTPGITAISSLGYHCFPTPELLTSGKFDALNPTHFLRQVPLDVLELMAGYIAPSELKSLCTVVPLFEPAAQRVLCFPHIEEYRLVQGSDIIMEEQVVENHLGEAVTKKRGPSLARKTFSTVVRGLTGPQLTVGGDGDYTGPAFIFSLGGDNHKVAWKLAEA